MAGIEIDSGVLIDESEHVLVGFVVVDVLGTSICWGD